MKTALLVLAMLGQLCKWDKNHVIIDTSNLYGIGGVPESDIDQIFRQQARKIMDICQLEIEVRRGGGGDIIPYWGQSSYFYMPCQRQPATGSFELGNNQNRGVTGMQSVEGKRQLLAYLAMHEAILHGTGLGHDPTASGGPMDVQSGRGGFQPHTNPGADPGPWEVAQVQERYGWDAPAGWYLVPRGGIKNGYNPPAIDDMPRINNAKRSPSRPQKPGYYWAQEIGSGKEKLLAVTPLGVVVQPGVGEVKGSDFRAWWGPINPPK